MGLAVVPRRRISMEGNSAVSLSLLEKPEHKLNLVGWTASVKRRAGADLSRVYLQVSGIQSNFYSMVYNTAVSP